MQTIAFSDYVLAHVHDEFEHLDKFCNLLEKLPPMDKDGPWIVGGTIRRLFAKEDFTTDVDIMFKNQVQFDDFCGQMRERGAETIAESDRQITFSYEGWEIQPIRAIYNDTLVKTLEEFDFTICQFGFDGSRFVWGDESMQHLKDKSLVFVGTNDHVSSMRRAFKYAEQGFFMSHESIGKFLKDAIKHAGAVDAADKKWEAEASASGGFPSGRRSSSGSYGI